jgi:hypothetical protein
MAGEGSGSCKRHHSVWAVAYYRGGVVNIGVDRRKIPDRSVFSCCITRQRTGSYDRTIMCEGDTISARVGR